MVPLALWGILVNLGGGIATAFGWVAQKYAHKQAIADSTSYYKKWLWWAGLFLVLVAQPLYIVSQSMANQSTLGVIGPFSIIINIMFGRIILKEKVTKWEYMGVLLFIPGIIVTLKFASKNNERLNREQFNDVFYSPFSMIYLITNIVVLLIFYGTAKKILEINPNEEHEDNEELSDDDQQIAGEISQDTKSSTDSRAAPGI